MADPVPLRCYERALVGRTSSLLQYVGFCRCAAYHQGFITDAFARILASPVHKVAAGAEAHYVASRLSLLFAVFKR